MMPAGASSVCQTKPSRNRFHLFNGSLFRKSDYLQQIRHVFTRTEPARFFLNYDSSPAEHASLFRDGGRVLDMVLTPLKDEQGGVSHALVQHIVLDDDGAVEKEPAEFRGMMQDIINLLPVRIFWKGRDLKYLGCNTVFAKDARLDAVEEILGRDDSELGWKEQAWLYQADDREVIRTGKPKLDYEEPQTTPQGNTIWLLTNKVPLRDPMNRIKGVVGTYDDITARKKAAEDILFERKRLLMLLDSFPGYIFLQTRDHRLRYTNSCFEKQFGYCAGVTGYEMLRKRNARREQCPLPGIFDSGLSEKWVWDPAPDGRVYEVSDFPFVDHDGTPLVLEIGIDITVKRKAEEQVRETLEDLQRFKKSTIGREHVMIQLKKEVNEFCHELGRPRPYDLSFL